MKRFLAAAVILLTLVPLALCQEVEKRPVGIDDLLSFKSVGDPQVSPDGKWVLYTLTTPDPKKNSSDTDIYRVPFEGGEAVRMTTSPKGDRSPRWSPDGNRIAFLSDRGEKTQVYAMRAFGGEAEVLTDHKAGAGPFAWRPDGKAILFRAQAPPTEKEEKDKKDKRDAVVVDEDPRPQQLWLFDLETKKTEQVTKGEWSVGSFEWSPDGETAYFDAAPIPKAPKNTLEQNSDIFAVKPGGEPELLFENKGPDGSPAISACGRYLAFYSRSGDLNPVGDQGLMMMELESREVTDLTGDFKPATGGGPAWIKDFGIMFAAVNGTDADFYGYDFKNEQLYAITEGFGVQGQFSLSADGRRAAFVHQGPETPPDVYAVEIGDGRFGEPRRVTEANPRAREWALGGTEVIRYAADDGLEIEAILVYPVGYEEGKRYPLLTTIHGGPSGVFTNRFNASSWGASAQYFAGRGWAVLHVNCRGSIGYGDEFQQANIDDWGGGDYRDIMSGVDRVVEMGVADPERLAVKGWSYGGYMTAWVVSQTGRFKAACVGAGLTNLVSMYGTNDIPEYLELYFSGDIYGDRLELYRDRSALAHISDAVTPTLILHGQEDDRVPTGQAREFYYALKKRGVPTQLVFYPREGHGPREINHQRDILRRWTTWFHKYALGEDVTFEEEKEAEEETAKEEASEER